MENLQILIKINANTLLNIPYSKMVDDTLFFLSQRFVWILQMQSRPWGPIYMKTRNKKNVFSAILEQGLLIVLTFNAIFVFAFYRLHFARFCVMGKFVFFFYTKNSGHYAEILCFLCNFLSNLFVYTLPTFYERKWKVWWILQTFYGVYKISVSVHI